jgi:FKBP-type peptidyl-prolyl cis-trans isomerase SlyD
VKIDRDTVVSLQYRVLDSDGETVDEGTEPLVYLHGGYGGLFDRVEEALDGKRVGETIEVRLQPDEAFGEYDPELVTLEARNAFPENIEIGMQFERADEHAGPDEADRLFTITDITDAQVVVDGNHPLAGMTLVFHATVAEVRAATEEEIEHGHPHGEGGHDDEDEDEND